RMAGARGGRRGGARFQFLPRTRPASDSIPFRQAGGNTECRRAAPAQTARKGEEIAGLKYDVCPGRDPAHLSPRGLDQRGQHISMEEPADAVGEAGADPSQPPGDPPRTEIRRRVQVTYYWIDSK